MSTNAPIVSVDNVSAGYGNTPIWENASFTLARGTFTAILGPNGAGKTTLLRLLLGLQKPLAGTLTVLGAPVRRGNPRISYMPQRRGLETAQQLDVFSFVRLGYQGSLWSMRARREAHAAVYAALDAADVGALAHRTLRTLSGGERQRVYLAQALVNDPEVLLLDEPLANLDLRREAAFVQQIATLVRKRGITAILITHNVNPLLPHLDTLLYVAGGQIAAGTPHDILTEEKLSALYGVPVEVLRDSRGRVAIIGAEEPEHRHD